MLVDRNAPTTSVQAPHGWRPPRARLFWRPPDPRGRWSMRSRGRAQLRAPYWVPRGGASAGLRGPHRRCRGWARRWVAWRPLPRLRSLESLARRRASVPPSFCPALCHVKLCDWGIGSFSPTDSKWCGQAGLVRSAAFKRGVRALAAMLAALALWRAPHADALALRCALPSSELAGKSTPARSPATVHVGALSRRVTCSAGSCGSSIRSLLCVAMLSVAGL